MSISYEECLKILDKFGAIHLRSKDGRFDMTISKENSSNEGVDAEANEKHYHYCSFLNGFGGQRVISHSQLIDNLNRDYKQHQELIQVT